MKDYSAMSDFEINKKVFKLKYGINPLSYAHNSDERSVGFKDTSGEYHWFDYCNLWADAGPIIAENYICLIFYVYEEPQDGGYWCASPAIATLDSEMVRHDNPLRAAMIVFLMMHGEKDEK